MWLHMLYLPIYFLIILERLFDQNVRRHWFSVIFRTLANVLPKLKLELNHSIGINSDLHHDAIIYSYLFTNYLAV